MATTATKEKPVLNAYQKLALARSKFLETNAKKSGKHMELEYKYFELDDIVPRAIPIFTEVGLLQVVNVSDEAATMYVVNIDDPKDFVIFSCPMRYPSENKMVNPVQALGSAVTYMRRYLYMLALDICEPDSIEPTTVKEDKPNKPAKAPATAQQREEKKQELTAPDGPADALQLQALKAAAERLLELDEDQADFVNNLEISTKGFTELSRAKAEKLIEAMTSAIEQYDE